MVRSYCTLSHGAQMDHVSLKTASNISQPSFNPFLPIISSYLRTIL